MKTRTITLKGWANNTNYMFSPNVNTIRFDKEYSELKEKLLKDGYKLLLYPSTLHGKRATEKVIIRGWYWRGEWADPTKANIYIYYK